MKRKKWSRDDYDDQKLSLEVYEVAAGCYNLRVKEVDKSMRIVPCRAKPICLV